MSERATVDGNEAAASVAYRLSEAIAIYPIPPARRWLSCATSGIAIRREQELGSATADVFRRHGISGRRSRSSEGMEMRGASDVGCG